MKKPISLRQYRKKNKIEAVDAAKELEITKPYLSMIETGKARPGLEVALRIQEFTGGTVRASRWHPALAKLDKMDAAS